mmetsp:Transcript_11376/g.21913  ORF Transcript_11376/g.21913 Transcript_11376/m.21913 type:complete len:122 (-) Transcript_11376:1640-2005(-)
MYPCMQDIHTHRGTYKQAHAHACIHTLNKQAALKLVPEQSVLLSSSLPLSLSRLFRTRLYFFCPSPPSTLPAASSDFGLKRRKEKLSRPSTCDKLSQREGRQAGFQCNAMQSKEWETAREN